MLTPENEAWKNVVGILYQDIWGDDKVKVIIDWLDNIRNTPVIADRDTEYRVRTILSTYYNRCGD